jgi:hypothetical protein
MFKNVQYLSLNSMLPKKISVSIIHFIHRQQLQQQQKAFFLFSLNTQKKTQNILLSFNY